MDLVISELTWHRELQTKKPKNKQEHAIKGFAAHENHPLRNTVCLSEQQSKQNSWILRRAAAFVKRVCLGSNTLESKTDSIYMCVYIYILSINKNIPDL